MAQPKEKYLVVGIGEVLWDIYRDRRYLGGAPANFAIHATQLGDQGVLVSRVGDDGMGRELVRALRQRPLPVEYLQLDTQKGTGTVMISLDIKGVPSFRCSRDVAFDYLEYVSDLESLAQRADAVYFGTLGQRSPIARKTIMQFLRAARNAVKVFDVNSHAGKAELQQIVPSALELADVVKVNRHEMGMLQQVLRREGDAPQKFAGFLMKKYRMQLVAVTHGEFGCEIFDGNTVKQVDGLPVYAIDTTGAGDAFAAGLVHKLLRGAPSGEIAEFANLIGAFLCTQSGASPVFCQQDIEAFRESM
jgi:fructokinase